MLSFPSKYISFSILIILIVLIVLIDNIYAFKAVRVTTSLVNYIKSEEQWLILGIPAIFLAVESLKRNKITWVSILAASVATPAIIWIGFF